MWMAALPIRILSRTTIGRHAQHFFNLNFYFTYYYFLFYFTFYYFFWARAGTGTDLHTRTHTLPETQAAIMYMALVQCVTTLPGRGEKKILDWEKMTRMGEMTRLEKVQRLGKDARAGKGSCLAGGGVERVVSKHVGEVGIAAQHGSVARFQVGFQLAQLRTCLLHSQPQTCRTRRHDHMS